MLGDGGCSLCFGLIHGVEESLRMMGVVVYVLQGCCHCRMQVTSQASGFPVRCFLHEALRADVVCALIVRGRTRILRLLTLPLSSLCLEFCSLLSVSIWKLPPRRAKRLRLRPILSGQERDLDFGVAWMETLHLYSAIH